MLVVSSQCVCYADDDHDDDDGYGKDGGVGSQAALWVCHTRKREKYYCSNSGSSSSRTRSLVQVQLFADFNAHTHTGNTQRQTQWPKRGYRMGKAGNCERAKEGEDLPESGIM